MKLGRVLLSKMRFKYKWEDDLKKSTQIHVMTVEGCEPRDKIAAFDLDGTIISTKSGRVFPLNSNDWKLLYDHKTSEKLKNLYQNEGYKIVIITNQNGIASGKTSVKDFRQKIENIVELLQIPLQLFCATEKHCVFRKPRPGFMELLARDYNGDKGIEQNQSFYCGDAAGRIRVKGKKDFSCSDRLFALNCGLKFYVPEELFLGQKVTDQVKLPDFNPMEFYKNPPKLLGKYQTIL